MQEDKCCPVSDLNISTAGADLQGGKEGASTGCSGDAIYWGNVQDVQFNGKTIVDIDGVANIKAVAITNEEIDAIWMK